MTLSQAVDKLTDFLLNLFFPLFCLGCSREGVLLCADCRATLEISQFNYCLCNKSPLRLPPGTKSGTCGSCRTKTLAGIYSAVPYQEKFLTRKLVYTFKEKPYLKHAASVLASIIAEHLLLAGNNLESVWEQSVIVPVPMEMSAMKRRGYNHAEVLAFELAKLVQTPCITDNLVKVRKTLPQKSLSKEQRKENLEGAFIIENPVDIAGKKVFLIDDVYTTGSTIEECAKVLKSAGVKQVWGIVFAREG